MAETIILTNDPITRKKWAKELFRAIMPATEINDLVGKSADSIIQQRIELGKGEGDVIKFDIRLPLRGEGVVGRDPVEGNEEELIFRQFEMTIEELNHAVSTGGRMEQQRIPYDLMVEAKEALQYWWADKLSDLAFAHLCGDSSFRIAGKTFAQNPDEPDDYHHLTVNDVAEANLTAADELDLSFLDRMKQRAETGDPKKGIYKIRPLRIRGKNYYRVILHNYVFDRLRQNTNVGQWGDLLRAANKLQIPQVEIEYNGMLISKSERIREVRPHVYRNILLGCQAACLAWGGAGETKSTVMAFVPYETDAKRFMNVRGGGILGLRKTRFKDINGTWRDFGVIVGSSYALPLD